jgi:hypothetical protein
MTRTMSMFNRRSEAQMLQLEPLSGLPAGFDDPGSESFVPEVLRPYWPADPSFALDAVLDDRLVGWAREDIGSDRYLELDALDEAGRTARIPQYWGDRHSGWRHDLPWHGQRLVFMQRLGAINEEALPKPNQAAAGAAVAAEPLDSLVGDGGGGGATGRGGAGRKDRRAAGRRRGPLERGAPVPGVRGDRAVGVVGGGDR